MTHEQWMRKAMILLIASTAEQMNGRNPAFIETIRVLNRSYAWLNYYGHRNALCN